MGKAKKNRKPMADTVYAKKSSTGASSNPFALAKPSTAKRLNPFEVHVNKEKFQILGRTCKHDKGLPGVSRAKAIKRRQQTLGLEYQEKHKANKFQDRRIGRHLNADELTDEVLNARFLADKLTEFKGNKLSKFNLNDDEVLTHRGTTLEEIEQFRDERSDDEEVGDEQLDADFIEAAHFGGGAEPVKDRKTAIEEMILEQKKRKVEIAKEKDELHDLTDKLDSNYKSLMPLMGKMTKTDKEKAPQDDFDKIMREMIFEPRSAVSDKLQSEEEVAKKEKERLEKLEQERLRRMRGENDETEGENQTKHRSADDLDDGYFANGDHNDGQNEILAYNMDGELDTNHSTNENGIPASDEEDQSADEESDNDGEEEQEDNEEENGSENEEDSEDDLSDLKEGSSDEETVTTKISPENVSKANSKKETKRKSQNEVSELPFTIDMPSKYEEFFKLLDKHQPEDQATIVERLIKCNHPKLDGVNREKVIKLFAFLLQYINEIFTEATAENVANQFQLLDKLNPHLYDLMHLNPERMSTTFLDVIKEKYSNYCKQSKMLPTLETLIFFKLVSNFFTTSDFRHPVVSPCFIFIEHILARSKLRTRQDIAAGIFLLTIVLEYTQQSKRFLPASFNFLLGILHLCLPKRAVELIKIIPPFKAQGPLSSLLVLNETEAEEIKKTKQNELLKSEDLLLESISSDFKVRALNTTLCLINEFIQVVGENVGANYLATPLLEMLTRLPIEVYPKDVQSNLEEAKEALNNLAKKSLTKLVPPEKKPKALRLLEPRFEAVYDDKRRPKMSKEKEERAKLLHKVKRETKGALREIRRDTEFIQKMRIQQQIKSDHERHEKVKRILHEASVQQGELNELDRARKRKKF